MKQLALVAALVAALSGCSRDLSLPPKNGLTVELPAATVAPRQRLQLTAAGGASGGYVFEFAPGGQRSGPSATLTADGAYQAGERGLDEDVVRVTDSAGSSATARISVGAPLSLTPALSSVAPGGRVDFVASGGKPPYVLQLADGGQPFDGGTWIVNGTGGSVEVVLASDATQDPLATAKALVSLGSSLVLYPASAQLAPNEPLAFVALGGQPLYRFTLAGTAGSSGTTPATIDAATGAYRPGSNDAPGSGGAIDVVRVTDANGQVVEAQVSVGPPLVLNIGTTSIRPLSETALSASGGKPPYLFGFQPRGNRSRGAIGPTSGTYVAGPNVGAIDLVQVTDATGTVASVPPLVVGQRQFDLPGSTTSQLIQGELDGDRRPDFATTNGFQFNIMLRLAQPDQQQSVALPPDVVTEIRAHDLDGNGKDELLLLSRTGVAVAKTRFDGALELAGTTPASTFTDGRAVAVGDWLYRVRTEAGCAGIERLALSSLGGAAAGGVLPAVRQCALPLSAAAQTFTLSAGAVNSSTVWIATAAADWTGYPSFSNGPFTFNYVGEDAGVPVVLRTATLPLPPGHRLLKYATTSPAAVAHLVDNPAAVGTGRILTLVNDWTTGASKLWAINAATPAQAFPPVTLPTRAPASGIAAMPLPLQRTAVAAWDGRSTSVPLLHLANDGGVTLAQQLLASAPVSAGLFVDLNLDGIPDLVTGSSSSSKVDLFPGDGDGYFARRARLQLGTFSEDGFLDLDGDGLMDIVAAERGALQTYWGAPDHQFAVGPRTSLSTTPTTLLVSDFEGDASPDLFFADDQGAFFVAQGLGAGAFAPARPVLNAQGGQDSTPSLFLRLADFGGAAQGPDAFANARNTATLVVGPTIFIRTSATTAVRRFVDFPPPGMVSCTSTPMNIDGTGADDLLAACASGSQTQLFTALSSGAGLNLSFGPWTAAGAPVGGVVNGWIKSPPGDPKRYILTHTGLTEISSSQGALTAEAFTLERLVNARFARLKPAGPLELVGQPALGGGEIAVVTRSPSGWAITQRHWVGSLVTPAVGVGTGPGPAADVLVSDALGVSVILKNDGDGGLR